MKLPDFNHARERWDSYKAFHVFHGHSAEWRAHTAPFVQFDTGELICTVREPRPEQRREYYPLGVTLVGSHDTKRPALFLPKGEPVKDAWLNKYSMQYLLVDHDSGRVVALTKSKLPGVPLRFNGTATAYFAGVGEPPVGGPIALCQTNPLTAGERRHINALRAASRAWLTLGGDAVEEAWAQYRSAAKFAPGPTPLPVMDLLKVDFNELTLRQRLTLDEFGTTAGQTRTSVPYLTLGK